MESENAADPQTHKQAIPRKIHKVSRCWGTPPTPPSCSRWERYAVYPMGVMKVAKVE